MTLAVRHTAARTLDTAPPRPAPTAPLRWSRPPDVEGWVPGDAVTVMPLRWDNTCPACLKGHQHTCYHLIFIGIDPPGAMQ